MQSERGVYRSPAVVEIVRSTVNNRTGEKLNSDEERGRGASIAYAQQRPVNPIAPFCTDTYRAVTPLWSSSVDKCFIELMVTRTQTQEQTTQSLYTPNGPLLFTLPQILQRV